MALDAAGIRAALPAPLRENWDRIAALDAALRSALGGDVPGELGDLAAQRSRCIEALFAAFPLDADTAALRAEALQHLLRENDALASAARQSLAAAADVATTARRQRKAISAYHEHPPGTRT